MPSSSPRSTKNIVSDRPVTRAWKRKTGQKKEVVEEHPQRVITCLNTCNPDSLLHAFQRLRRPDTRILYFNSIHVEKKRSKRQPFRLVLTSSLDDPDETLSKAKKQRTGAADKNRKPLDEKVQSLRNGYVKTTRNSRSSNIQRQEVANAEMVRERQSIQTRDTKKKSCSPVATQNETENLPKNVTEDRQSSDNLIRKHGKHKSRKYSFGDSWDDEVQSDLNVRLMENIINSNELTSNDIKTNPSKLLNIQHHIQKCEEELQSKSDGEEYSRLWKKLEVLKENEAIEENHIKLKGLLMEKERVQYYINKTRKFLDSDNVSQNERDYLLSKILMTLGILNPFRKQIASLNPGSNPQKRTKAPVITETSDENDSEKKKTTIIEEKPETNAGTKIDFYTDQEYDIEIER